MAPSPQTELALPEPTKRKRGRPVGAASKPRDEQRRGQPGATRLPWAEVKVTAKQRAAAAKLAEELPVRFATLGKLISDLEALRELASDAPGDRMDLWLGDSLERALTELRQVRDEATLISLWVLGEPVHIRPLTLIQIEHNGEEVPARVVAQRGPIVLVVFEEDYRAKHQYFHVEDCRGLLNTQDDWRLVLEPEAATDAPRAEGEVSE